MLHDLPLESLAAKRRRERTRPKASSTICHTVVAAWQYGAYGSSVQTASNCRTRSAEVLRPRRMAGPADCPCVHPRVIRNGAQGEILHADIGRLPERRQRLLGMCMLFLPGKRRSVFARHVVQGRQFDYMQDFRRDPLCGNWVVPEPGHVECGIKLQNTSGRGLLLRKLSNSQSSNPASRNAYWEQKCDSMFSRRFFAVVAVCELCDYVHDRLVEACERVVVHDLLERVGIRLFGDDHARWYVSA